MSTTQRPQATVRRFKQVYVDIPPSPLHFYTTMTRHVAPVPSTILKENTPLRPSHGNMPQKLTSVSSKRKLGDHEASSMAEADAKKTKFMASDLASEFIYCHQCNKKRDAADSIRCTYIGLCPPGKGKAANERRCVQKFCKSCLKNRYGENIDMIKLLLAQKKAEKGHADDERYTFKCPKCREICNCARCRKLKGLVPTGNLTNAARRAGVSSAAQVSVDDPTVGGIMPGKGAQVEKQKSIPSCTGTVPTTKSSKRVETKAPAKPPPIVRWTRLPVNLDRHEAEARIQIREFTLRFARIMEPAIAKPQLEELEEIAGKGKDCNENDGVTGWVSEACVKSILLGLLGLIDNGKGGHSSKLIGAAINNIQASGANLNKMWASLAPLREQCDYAHLRSTPPHKPATVLVFPDPLPPPASAIIHNTRRSAYGSPDLGKLIYVASSAQMVPVLAALIDAALVTEGVRGEIENGLREERERVRETKEATKNENERWDRQRKDLEVTRKGKDKTKGQEEGIKAKRNAHKRHLQNIDNALKVASPSFAPRFGPLGNDDEGRIVWVLSPGVMEKDNALDFITSMASETGNNKQVQKGKKGRGGQGERRSMRKWSLFVAVWGKTGPQNGEMIIADDKTDNRDEKDNEGWWGFWEPEEIRNFADSIVIKTRLRGDDGALAGDQITATSPYEELVEGLNNFATLLEWRTCD